LSNSRLVCLAILTIAYTAPTIAFSQGQPQLRIESPADGALVHPGQTIKVRVTSPSGAGFSTVTLAGEGPLPFMTEAADSLPAEFAIKIPAKIDSRRYSLTARGRTTAGNFVETTIQLDIERPDPPLSVFSFQFPNLRMQTTDPPFYLIILANFSDQKEAIAVTESSYLSYRSTNPAVATVDKSGAVTAVALGAASIEVTYRAPDGSKVGVSVPVSVLAELP
jgi:Big-like domain-containing protein